MVMRIQITDSVVRCYQKRRFIKNHGLDAIRMQIERGAVIQNSPTLSDLSIKIESAQVLQEREIKMADSIAIDEYLLTGELDKDISILNIVA
ncbi:MAG TPA: hypothetical protein DD622_05100 [Opitutae bacterium]|nr:hypothetical protein [Opitutae bacterium]